jgi:hypothetical protein
MCLWRIGKLLGVPGNVTEVLNTRLSNRKEANGVLCYASWLSGLDVQLLLIKSVVKLNAQDRTRNFFSLYIVSHAHLTKTCIHVLCNTSATWTAAFKKIDQVLYDLHIKLELNYWPTRRKKIAQEFSVFIRARITQSLYRLGHGLHDRDTIPGMEQPSRPTQRLGQWVPGTKRPEPETAAQHHLISRLRRSGLYLHYPIRLNGVVRRKDLTFYPNTEFHFVQKSQNTSYELSCSIKGK